MAFGFEIELNIRAGNFNIFNQANKLEEKEEKLCDCQNLFPCCESLTVETPAGSDETVALISAAAVVYNLQQLLLLQFSSNCRSLPSYLQPANPLWNLMGYRIQRKTLRRPEKNPFGVTATQARVAKAEPIRDRQTRTNKHFLHSLLPQPLPQARIIIVMI